LFCIKHFVTFFYFKNVYRKFHQELQETLSKLHKRTSNRLRSAYSYTFFSKKPDKCLSGLFSTGQIAKNARLSGTVGPAAFLSKFNQHGRLVVA